MNAQTVVTNIHKITDGPLQHFANAQTCNPNFNGSMNLMIGNLQYVIVIIRINQNY